VIAILPFIQKTKRNYQRQALCQRFSFLLPNNLTLAEAAEKPIVWKISSAFSPGSFLYKDLLPRFSEEVDKRSGGKLKIKMYPPGALMKVRDLYNAVQKGVVEGGMLQG
jgi:TRAP-type C4-dicarboxylate transport system substrate-binding protein